MASIPGGDPWRIPQEERAKHDAQFFSLTPSSGMITGDQARGFFLQSGLPPVVLGHIWALADMNADGKMDKKEFSIAMHLIHKKLLGFELPKVLPPSLKSEVAPGFGAMPGALGMAPPGAVGGGAPVAGFAPAPMSSPPPAALAHGEWGVPHGTKLKYTQKFNMLDRTKKGHLTGLEAREVLTQSNLTHSLLAQIWNLSDVDNDGNLTTEEFVLAMFLVDLAKTGQPLPAKLPPELVPPSYRRGRSGSAVSVGVAPVQMTSPPGQVLPGTQPVPAPPGSPSHQSSTSAVFHVTFEDKRQENFMKGQAELERRRELLRAEQKKMEEERLAHERAEAERRERIRQEQERKKQQELDKHLQKQREVEHEREEQRRKALEQREAARRELERQRQLEWERQRREQLMGEKLREQNMVDQMKSDVAKMKMDLETLENRKVELNGKIVSSRNGVTEFTKSIDSMRTTRDVKLANIEKFQNEIVEWTEKLKDVQQERQENDKNLEMQNSSISDTYRTVMHSYNSKQQMIEKMRRQLEQLEQDTATKLEEIDKCNSAFNEVNTQVTDLTNAHEELVSTLSMKQEDWTRMKRKQDGLPSPERDEEKLQNTDKFSSTSAAWWKDEKGGSDSTKRDEKTADWLSSLKTNTSTSSLSSLDWGTTTSTASMSKNSSVEWSNPAMLSNLYKETSELTGASNTASIDWTQDGSTTASPGWDVSTAAAESAGGSKATVFETVTSTSSILSTTSATKPAQASLDLFPSDAFGSTTTSSQAEYSNSAWANSLFTKPQEAPKPGCTLYKALYQFEARNPDELSLNPDDIVSVDEKEQAGAEAGWMAGDCNDQHGWFPQAYVEMITMAAPAAVQTPPSATSPPSTDPVAENKEDVKVHVENAASNRVQEVMPEQTPVTLALSAESSFTAVTASAPSPTPGQGQKAEEGLQAQALYPWRAKKSNHLTFNKGDIINVHEQQDMWWSGSLGDKVGWFPKSYVKVLGGTAGVISEVSVEPKITIQTTAPTSSGDPSPAPDAGSEYYVALYAYSSSEPGDLTFNQGDVILVLRKDSDWWTGALNEKTGIFPANYVKMMDTQDEETHTESPLPGIKLTKKPEIASVIAPYQATGPEQLSLVPGQLIHVRKKSNSGWWEGELQARGQKRKIGWFPANYVKLLGPSSARSTPDPAWSSPLKSASPNLSDTGSRTETPQPYPQPTTTAPALEQVMALFNYTSQNEDELTFLKGSVLNVIDKEDKDWWKGELNGTTGVFPSNYVVPLSEAVTDGQDTPNSSSWAWGSHLALSPTESKRQSHIQELIDTEESYAKDMKVMIEAFSKPMLSEGVFTQEESLKIFVNWKELIMCNTKLLKALRVRRKMTGEGQVIHMVGDILCENLPHMTVYIRFCSCQLNAAIFIQYKSENDNHFKEVHKKCVQHPGTKGMPISSFLLKPMQRITKYPLMIEKILQYTPPEHPDNQNLQDALAKAQEICQQVNEGVREKENSDRLEWIQNHVNCDGLPEKITFNSVTNSLGPRKFLYSGSLYKAKSGKELVGFLFNDFLLLVQPQRPLGSVTSVFSLDIRTNMQFKMYRTPVFLNEVMIKRPTEAEGVDSTLFHLSHIDRMYSLKAVNSTERDTWIKKIDAASKFYIETERKKRERAHSSRSYTKGCGRLLVIVLEGYNLIPSDSNGKSDPYCEVSMGVQEHRTKVINNSLNPKWNASMQFTIKDLHEDVLCITVYDRDLFTPNDFLGRTEVRIKDIVKETREKKGPITKRLVLHEVDSGEVVVKLDLQIYDST